MVAMMCGWEKVGEWAGPDYFPPYGGDERFQKMCEKLNIQLHTYVMDWPTMKELTRAFMLSGLANLDVPQDHLFASVVPMMAKKYHNFI